MVLTHGIRVKFTLFKGGIKLAKIHRNSRSTKPQDGSNLLRCKEIWSLAPSLCEHTVLTHGIHVKISLFKGGIELAKMHGNSGSTKPQDGSNLLRCKEIWSLTPSLCEHTVLTHGIHVKISLFNSGIELAKIHRNSEMDQISWDAKRFDPSLHLVDPYLRWI